MKRLDFRMEKGKVLELLYMFSSKGQGIELIWCVLFLDSRFWMAQFEGQMIQQV